MKFYASVRLEVRRLPQSKNGTIKDGDTIVGHKLNVKAVKNKCAMPFRETVVDLLYSTGFDKTEDLINYALKIGVLTGSAWFVMPGYNHDEKFRREDLPLDKVRAEVLKYHQNLQKALEESSEKTS